MSADLRTIAEIAPAIQRRDITSEAITRQCLERIDERNGALNAFITVLADQALDQARAADAEIASGRYRGPLHGIPISLKDLIDVRGVPTSAASRVRADHVAARDAAVTGRLREAGAVIIGKTNLHEFAFGTTNEDSAFGPARHPLDPNRSPGGSSGGSAVSVADGMCYASIGTDTGGSVRIPAAACGIVGLKPAFGDVPVDGVVPLSTTLDHVGPLCRSVADAAIVFDALRSGDGRRPAAPDTSAPPDVRGMRFGVPRPYFMALLDSQVAAAFESACQRLVDAGATIDEVEIPHAADIAPVYLHIVLPEAAAYHAKMLDSRADDYTPAVRIRLELGRYVMAEDYLRALSGRRLLIRETDAALQHRDALLLPALAIPAPKLGTATVRFGGVEEQVRTVMLRLTQPFNITGHPAIAIPCGKTAIEGLPLSAQLVGARGDTAGLLRLAAAAEPYLGPGTSR